MKHRVVKKRAHRFFKQLARRIPSAFKNSRDRKAWVKEISDYQIRTWKQRGN